MKPRLFFPFFIAWNALSAELPEKYCGDWVLVNSTLVISVEKDGTAMLRHSGEKGEFDVGKDEAVTWKLPRGVEQGHFKDGALFMKNSAEDVPAWLKTLEFRKAPKEIAQGVVIFSSEQQKAGMNAFARVRRDSLEKMMLNDARQLAAGAQQHMLETNTDSMIIEVDNTTGEVKGPLAQYVQKISINTTVVEGKIEGSDGTFTLRHPVAFGGHDVIFDSEGRLKK